MSMSESVSIQGDLPLKHIGSWEASFLSPYVTDMAGETTSIPHRSVINTQRAEY